MILRHDYLFDKMSSKCLLQFCWFSLKAFLSWKNKPWPQPKMRSPPIYIILTSSACDFSVLTSEKYWSDLLRYMSTNSSLHSWHTPRHVAKTWDILVTRDNCPQHQTHFFCNQNPGPIHCQQLHVLPLAVHLRFFCWTSRGPTLNISYSLSFIVGPLLHA